MLSRNKFAVAALGVTLAAVPAVAVAASGPEEAAKTAPRTPLAGEALAAAAPSPAATQSARERKYKLIRDNAVLAEALKDERGAKFSRAAHVERVDDWSTGRLKARNAHFEHKLKHLRAASSTPAGQASVPGAGAAAPARAQAGGGGGSGSLDAIAACESGGDPSAVGGGGQFRGKYQFDQQTWQSVGGSGDPAAAPEAEQDERAAILQSRSGSSPWPSCG